MAIEVKDILDYFGFDTTKINSIDDFKTNHSGNFIKKDNIEAEVNGDKKLQSAIFGKRLGTAQTKVVQSLKAMGVDLKDDEIKDKQLEEIFDLGLQKQVALATKAIDEAKGAAGEPAKVVKELQEKYSQLETKLNGEVELKKNLQKEYEGYKTTVATEKKTGKINEYKQKAWSDFKWDSVTLKDPLKMKGFKSEIEEKYQIQLDEKDEAFVTDAKGERIKSSKKAGEWKSFNEVLEEEGMTAKVWAAANNKPAAPVVARQNLNTGTHQQQQQAQTEQVYVHPAALRG